MNTNVADVLQSNLRKFGLNPKHWQIRPVQDSKYAITNIQDGQFYFLGEVDTTKKTPTWNRLVLTLF